MVRKFAYFAYLESGVTPHLGLQVKKYWKAPITNYILKERMSCVPKTFLFFAHQAKIHSKKGNFSTNFKSNLVLRMQEMVFAGFKFKKCPPDP
jgi:hypothetical protein